MTVSVRSININSATQLEIYSEAIKNLDDQNWTDFDL